MVAGSGAGTTAGPPAPGHAGRPGRFRWAVHYGGPVRYGGTGTDGWPLSGIGRSGSPVRGLL